MGKVKTIGILGLLILGGACGSSDDGRRPELRDALDRAQVSLIESVDVALAETEATAALTAALYVEDEQFRVDALDQGVIQNVRVNMLTGYVVSTAEAGAGSDPCPDAISLTEALAIAEEEASGEAVAVTPDDDVECAREIQVMQADTLYEVKVAGDGEVLEYELSDEYGGGEDDD